MVASFLETQKPDLQEERGGVGSSTFHVYFPQQLSITLGLLLPGGAQEAQQLLAELSGPAE